MADALTVSLPAGADDESSEEEEEEEVVVVEEGDDEASEEEEAGAKGSGQYLAPGAQSPDGKATPNTLRNKYDVNSPRKKGDHSGWLGANQDEETKDEEASGGARPEDLVTQVERPDPSSLVTQVPRPELPAKPDGWGLLDCFMCCGSAPDVEQKLSMEATAAATKTATQAAGKMRGPAPQLSVPQQSPTDPQAEDSDSEPASLGGLLPAMAPEDKGKKCLVLDLDETLVHSSFKPVSECDFTIPVNIEGVVYTVYVLKRPFVDEFLAECAKHYELVVFTASLGKYAHPLLDTLDPHKLIKHRLFRESCVLHGTAYVKDLSKLGRRMRDIIFVDNSPLSYTFQPENAVPCTSWFDDPRDTELRDLLPVLQTTLKEARDVRKILDANKRSFRWLCDQAHKDPKSFG